MKETHTTAIVPEATQFRVLAPSKENVVSIKQIKESKHTEKFVETPTAVEGMTL